MSDLEKDIEKARAEHKTRDTYDTASLKKIRLKAAKVYQDYEKEMEQRFLQEMVNDYKHHLYS